MKLNQLAGLRGICAWWVVLYHSLGLMGNSVPGPIAAILSHGDLAVDLFFLLSGVSLFVLRRREPDAPRPFRVPFYPVVPLIFCGVCAFMLWSSLSYVSSQSLGGTNAAWIGVAVLALLVAGWVWRAMPDGIRPAAQKELADAKVPHRILISYGAHWFPWYMRRLAERPANLAFFLRALAHR